MCDQVEIVLDEEVPQNLAFSLPILLFFLQISAELNLLLLQVNKGVCGIVLITRLYCAILVFYVDLMESFGLVLVERRFVTTNS